MTTAAAIGVVSVHGGFVDGAGWEGVYQTLKKGGYAVSIVQNPTQSLAGDVAATKLVLAMQDRPVVSRRPLLRGRRDHGSGHRFQGRRTRVHRRIRSRSR